MSEQELWNELGNLYFMSGAYNQAIHAYRRSIQIGSDFGRPYSNLAWAYVQQGKYEEAIHLLRKSIDLLDNDKEKAITWMRLGSVFRRLKDYQEAIFAYQNADELDPESSRTQTGPATVLFTPSDPFILQADSIQESTVKPLNGQQDETIESNLEVEAGTPLPEIENVSLIPANPSLYAQTVSEISTDASVESWADACLEEEVDSLILPGPDSDPSVPDPYQEDLQDWPPIQEPSAEEFVYESCEHQPLTTPASDFGSATYYQEASPYISAPSLATESYNPKVSGYAENTDPQTLVDLEERPSNTIVVFDQDEPAEPGFTELAVAVEAPDVLAQDEPPEEEINKAEIKIEKMRRVVQLNPRNGFAWDTLGNLYKSINRFKEAILAYQQAISTDDTKAFYYHHLALAYAAEGRDEDAVGALQKVVELDPGHSLAHATLGGYFRKMGLEELAQKHIGKAMKSIFDSENEYNQACLEAICGNADHAIDLLRVALEKKQTYIDWVLRDPDLDFVRQDPRFKQLISDYTR